MSYLFIICTHIKYRVKLYQYEVIVQRSYLDKSGVRVSALQDLVDSLVNASNMEDLSDEIRSAVQGLVDQFKGFHILSFTNHESMCINDQVNSGLTAICCSCCCFDLSVVASQRLITFHFSLSLSLSFMCVCVCY
jgi:hypothetical protein